MLSYPRLVDPDTSIDEYSDIIKVSIEYSYMKRCGAFIVSHVEIVLQTIIPVLLDCNGEWSTLDGRVRG